MRCSIHSAVLFLFLLSFIGLEAQDSKSAKGKIHQKTTVGAITSMDQSYNPPNDSAFKDPEYEVANSAKDADYLSDEEKKVYFYLNLARLNPKLFAETYLGHLRNSKNRYESSLYKELVNMASLPLLKPNRKLYESARCHADEMGERGLIGHRRLKCAEYFTGECCEYGSGDAFTVLIELLIDDGISSLGHRRICLSASYHELGVSIRPHKTYRFNTVMDFM
ncbi:MAG: CAP domain-containing protein [Bacteroidetes bacterium]|nr:CAP domain-containing protein [Bacteroidota bacterium]